VSRTGGYAQYSYVKSKSDGTLLGRYGLKRRKGEGSPLILILALRHYLLQISTAQEALHSSHELILSLCRSVWGGER